MNADFSIVQGDTAPVFTDTLTYDDGTPVNLTGATLSFVMRSLVAASPLTLTGTTTSPSPTTGAIQFAPSLADTAVAGNYMAQWVVVFSGGTRMTFPTVGYISVEIAENLVSAGGQQLVSLTDVKEYLNLQASDRSRDSKLVRYIRAARPVVENITGPIVSTVYDEWHDGGSPLVQIRRRPSTSYDTAPILTLLTADEFVGATKHQLDIVADPAHGTAYSCMIDNIGTITRLTAGGSATPFSGGVHITYRAGQSAIPPNVYEGTLELLRVNYEKTMAVGRAGSIVPVSDEDSSNPPLSFFVPRRVREMLAPNRRAPSVA